MRHTAAFFSAALAGVRAALAVIHLVLATRGAARFTDIRTNPAQLLRKLRASAHKGRRQPAGFCAVAVQANALGHFGDIALAQARIGTVFTGLGTFDAGLNACLEFLLRHCFCPFSKWVNGFPFTRLQVLRLALRNG